MGNIQCFKHYWKALLRTYTKTGYVACFDMMLSFMAPYVQVVSSILTLVLFIFRVINVQLYDVFAYMYSYGLLFFLISYMGNVLLNIFVVVYNKKNVKKTMSGILSFTFFMLTWIPINFVCLFKKDLTWEPIKHERNIDIDDIKE